ncbi:MAG: hypothetical protein LBF38_04755 [Deltaproteobacteria bacterium]|jgi:uncharacterized Zn finger protein|nr:hypothetical protein [Deltaproteobacteria bacterium]
MSDDRKNNSRNFYFKGTDKRDTNQFKKNRKKLDPVLLTGKTIARSFWGVSWLNRVEKLLGEIEPMELGRAHLRNDEVVHLEIAPGKVEATIVDLAKLKAMDGAHKFLVTIKVKPLSERRLEGIKSRYPGLVPSLEDLLEGRLSPEIVKAFLDPLDGILPSFAEIKAYCSCMNGAPCGHIGAALYGVANRLDKSPELVFLLRKVDPVSLVATEAEILFGQGPAPAEDILEGDLSSIFGIDLAPTAAEAGPEKGPETGPKPQAEPMTEPRPSQSPMGPEGLTESLSEASLSQKPRKRRQNGEAKAIESFMDRLANYLGTNEKTLKPRKPRQYGEAKAIESFVDRLANYLGTKEKTIKPNNGQT